MADRDPLDVHIGERLRLLRTLRGFSQERLGLSLGITFQQVQKYERGANRIGASRLYHISRVLGVGVPYFFDGMNRSADDSGESGDDGTMHRRETLELVRAYERIADGRIRRRFFDVVRVIGDDAVAG